MTLSITCDFIHSSFWPARLFRRAPRTATLAALLLGSSSALAQPTQSGKLAAEALFQEARPLVKKGDYAAACPKFEASFALFPAIGTLLNIGDCHKHEGKLATAWGDYRRVLEMIAQSPGEERQAQKEIATREILALEPRLPKLRVVVPSPPPELEVWRAGSKLPASAFGEPLVADPGQIEVRSSAPGYRPETQRVTLTEGRTTTIEVSLVAVTSSPDEQRQRSAGAPAWAWVTGGAGLALTGVGVYFLIDDLNAVSHLRSSCHTNATGTYCAPGYDFARDNARKDRDLALGLGLGGAGVLALGAAVFGIVRAPSSKASTAPHEALTAAPWVSQGYTGAMISGSF